MQITAIGIDLAKNVFQIHGVDTAGKTCLRKQVKRDQMANFFANLSPCLIGMEACGSAHFWARKLETMGHTVKLMAPQFVKPYVKTNKNDVADAPDLRHLALTTRASRNVARSPCSAPPSIRFLSIGSQFRSTLPPHAQSPFRSCSKPLAYEMVGTASLLAVSVKFD